MDKSRYADRSHEGLAYTYLLGTCPAALPKVFDPAALMRTFAGLVQFSVLPVICTLSQ